MRAQAYAQQMELAGVIDAARRSQGLKQGSDGRWEVAYQPGGPGTAPAATAPTYVTTPASRQQAEAARLDPNSRPRERSPFVGMANPRPGPSVGELLGQSVARSTAAPQGQLALAVDQERQRRNSSAVAPLATWPPAKRASEAEKEAVAAAQIATPARSERENAAGGLPPVTTGLSSVPGQMRTPESEQNLREITRRVVNGVEVGGNRQDPALRDWQAQGIQARAGLPWAEPPRSKLLSGEKSDVRIRPTPVVPTTDRTAEEIEAERAGRRAAAMERRGNFTYVTTPASRYAAEKPELEQSELSYVRRRESDPRRRMRNPLPGPSVGDLLEESLRSGATANSGQERPIPVAEGQLELLTESMDAPSRRAFERPVRRAPDKAERPARPAAEQFSLLPELTDASPLGGAEQLLQEALGRVPTSRVSRDEGVSLYSKKQSDDANEFDPGRPPTKVGPSDYFELEMKTVRGDGSSGKPRKITPAQVSRTGPGPENATAAWQQDASVNAVRNILARNETDLMSSPVVKVQGSNLRAATPDEKASMGGLAGRLLAGFGTFGGRGRAPVGPLGDGRDYAEALKRAKPSPIYRTEKNGVPLLSEDGRKLFRIGNPYARDYDAVREEVLDLIPGSRVRSAKSFSPRSMLDLLDRGDIEAAPVNFALPPSVSPSDAVKALGVDASALDGEFGEGGRPDALVIELSRPDPTSPDGRRKGLAVGARVPGQPGLHWTVPGQESRSALPILGTDGTARKKAATELGLDRPNDVLRELEAMANAADPSAPSWSLPIEREVRGLVSGRGSRSLPDDEAFRVIKLLMESGLDHKSGLGRMLIEKYGKTTDAAPAARPARDSYSSVDDTAFPVVPIELEDDVRALAMERPELMDSSTLEQMIYGSERENLSGAGSDAMDYTDADEFLDLGREKDLLEPEGLDYGYGGGSRFDDSRLERSPEELRAQAAARAVIARMGGNRTGQQYDQDAELLAERILQVAPPAPAALQPDPYGVRAPVGPFKDGGAYAKALKQRRIDELVTLVQTQAAKRLYSPPVQTFNARAERQAAIEAVQRDQEAAAWAARAQLRRDVLADAPYTLS